MTTEQLITIAISPVSVAIVGWWLKSNLARSEQSAAALMKLEVMQASIARIEASLDRVSVLSDSMILLQKDTETQWTRIDDHRDRIKDIETRGRA